MQEEKGGGNIKQFNMALKKILTGHWVFLRVPLMLSHQFREKKPSLQTHGNHDIYLYLSNMHWKPKTSTTTALSCKSAQQWGTHTHELIMAICHGEDSAGCLFSKSQSFVWWDRRWILIHETIWSAGSSVLKGNPRSRFIPPCGFNIFNTWFPKFCSQ